MAAPGLFDGEFLDDLELALVEELEVFLLERADGVSPLVANDDRNQDQIYLGAEVGRGFKLARGHLLDLRKAEGCGEECNGEVGVQFHGRSLERVYKVQPLQKRRRHDARGAGRKEKTTRTPLPFASPCFIHLCFTHLRLSLRASPAIRPSAGRASRSLRRLRCPCPSSAPCRALSLTHKPWSSSPLWRRRVPRTR